jgi:hypothetical protein
MSSNDRDEIERIKNVMPELLENGTNRSGGIRESGPAVRLRLGRFQILTRRGHFRWGAFLYGKVASTLELARPGSANRHPI